MQNKILPYENDWTCFSCSYNVKKTKKTNLQKYNRKKLLTD